MAHDGFEAVAIAEDFRPDVILLDIGMPGLSGYADGHLGKGNRMTRTINASIHDAGSARCPIAVPPVPASDRPVPGTDTLLRAADISCCKPGPAMHRQ